MSIEPSEAAAALQSIAAVERRTREAVFYAGASAIFIMWGVLVAAGYVLSELSPRSARVTWVATSALGCAATAIIVILRMRARARETRDWRLLWAIVILTAFGAAWSYLLGPIVPRPMIYAFQPSLVLLGVLLVGLWLGRFLVILGIAGIALIALGAFLAEPWLGLWMASVQSGTFILGGLWLGRVGIPQ
jgi:hypothetical protein